MADTKKIIRQINTGTETYDISALYLRDTNGVDHSYEDIQGKYDELIDIAQGAIDTYVIPVSKKDTGIYGDVVGSDDHTTGEISVADLILLLTPENKSGEFKVGDIILMEAESTDGKKTFDRWVSWVSEDGKKVKLTVLESQVAKHYHTFEPTVSSGSAYVDSNISYTVELAKVGESVSVVYSASGDVVTDVEYENNGAATTSLSITTGNSTSGVSHTHTVNSHNHSFNPNTLISGTVKAYTSLVSDTYKPHSHTSVNVAGAHTNGNVITFATGVVSEKEDVDFVKNLTDSSELSTGVSSPKTGNNEGASETNAVKTGENITVGDTVKTTSSGAHTHTATVSTGSSVVTSVNVAPSVVTSVKYTDGSVQSKVITDVTTNDVTVATSWKEADKSTFVSAWTCSVDTSGVLKFTVSSADAVTSATKISTSGNVKSVNVISSGNQTNATCEVSRVSQSASSQSVNLNVTVSEAGSHQHGFSHVHTLPTHTHTVGEHSHTYVKTIVSQTGKAISSITLATDTYTPHTHNSVNVAGAHVDGTELTYFTSGSQTDVVTSLVSSATVSTENLTIGAEYIGVAGTITMPQLKPTTTSLLTMLSTKNITPATAGESAIKSITFTPGNFVTTVSIGNTSDNIGGTPNE